MRLIDADKLHYHKVWIEKDQKFAVVVFAKEIDHAPTIDAEPVVRCKDCECWECGQDTKGEIYKSHLCDVFECGTTAYDFCSYGERKGGAKTDEEVEHETD